MSANKKRASSGGVNAFEMLMNKKSRTPKSSLKSSRFVDCPAGCGAHIAEHQVNQHLDTCIGSAGNSEAKPTRSESDRPREAEQATNLNRSEENEARTFPDSKKPADDAATQSSSDSAVAHQPQHSQNAVQSNDPVPTISQSPEAGPNAFSHMMKQAHQVFTAKEPLRQRFHLHSDGRLTWTNLTDDLPGDVWSSKVVLKASRMIQGEPSYHQHSRGPQPRDVELTISSSIPPSTEQTRLVKRHSRLSVPVLKSILQKSVRRRRPLPAVRVAMELMDKAMGELLRRLPIIVLEDSTLHPDLPLLVWAMVAESKDFVIPPQVVTRILRIVYEMSSCPWTDCIGDSKSHASAGTMILLSSPIPLFQEANVTRPDECEMLLRSMLLRAQYGGMAGDMKMLHEYVYIWSSRFRDDTVPAEVLQRAKPIASTGSQLKWVDTPKVIHERPKLQSQSHVPSLVQQSLDKLTFQDICLAGVDFHCSSVLDHVISNDADFDRCYEGLCVVAVQAGLSPLPTNKEKQRSYLTQIMKRCMWNFSSGVNHRRALCSDTTKESCQKEAALRKFWNEHLASGVEDYMKNYVESRLAC